MQWQEFQGLQEVALVDFHVERPVVTGFSDLGRANDVTLGVIDSFFQSLGNEDVVKAGIDVLILPVVRPSAQILIFKVKRF